MKATGFEVRHQTLFHVLIVAVALLTYAIYPDDIVWASVRHHANNRLLERLVFGIGAIVVVGAAGFESWVTAHNPALEPGKFLSGFPGRYAYLQKMLRLERLLFASGLGLLLPLPGTVILIGCEAVMVLRLHLREREDLWKQDLVQTRHTRREPIARSALSLERPGERTGSERSWLRGFRVSAAKWGVAASLILLCATLQDRIAEVAAGIGFLAWLAMNVHRSLVLNSQN